MLSEKQGNIYNKQIRSNDGTLIDNWYEERELRNQTGEGRHITGGAFGKYSFDPETLHTSTNPRDNTFKRVIGTKEPDSLYNTTNELYGTKIDEMNRYTHPKMRQEQLDQEVTIQIQEYKENQLQEERKQREFRSFETTNNAVHVPQPFDNYVGLRHMKTQDNVEIPREKAINFIPIEKLKKMGAEAAQAEMEEKMRRKQEQNKALATGKEEEPPLSIWMTKVNTSDMYRSFIKGNNPFARSHAFTQPIQRTRGAEVFYQNAKDSKIDEGFLKAQEEERKKWEEARKKKEGKKE